MLAGWGDHSGERRRALHRIQHIQTWCSEPAKCGSRSKFAQKVQERVGPCEKVNLQQGSAIRKDLVFAIIINCDHSLTRAGHRPFTHLSQVQTLHKLKLYHVQTCHFLDSLLTSSSQRLRSRR
eukprot:s287_g8.t1